MKATISLLLKGIVSNDALNSLYRLRRALAPEADNRTRLSTTVAAATLLVLMLFLVAVTFVHKDPKRDLVAKGRLVTPEAGLVHWTQDPAAIALDGSAEQAPVALGLVVDAAAFSSLVDFDRVFVVSLPSFEFENLEIALDQRPVGRFVRSESAYVHVDRERIANGDKIAIDLRLTPVAGQRQILRPMRAEPLLVAGARDFAEFQQARAVANAGRGGFAGLMARIVMAVFVLILFLFVDGSPESLGMALFLGFEAAALTTSFGWLPRAYDAFIVHYLSQMGDIFRMYFFLQLARVVDKRMAPWFWWGTAASIPYGLLRQYEVPLGLHNLVLIPIWRDVVIGLGGALICLRAAQTIFGKGLNWRVAALAIAALGSLQQVVGPASFLLPELAESEVYAALADVFAPLSVYLLVLSVFINISTLERRVRSLSQVAINAKEMERDMVLGQAVQESLLRRPEFPAEIGVECHHEPAMYVSGDIYFVHWDAERDVLTVLLSDITGHGVQAALKAAVCLTLAEALWSGEVRSGDDVTRRMELYDLRVCSYLSRIAKGGETLALLGLEFDRRANVLSLYRANSVFPLAIEQVDGRWRARTVVLPNKTIQRMSVLPGTSVIFLSDGYIGRSRTQLHLQTYLNRRLEGLAELPDSAGLKAILREYDGYDDSGDDRTLLIFQAPRSAEAPPVDVAA